MWIDLLKFYTTSYGTDFFTSDPLYFWMTFGGFGSSSNPGQGFSGQYVFYCRACVSKTRVSGVPGTRGFFRPYCLAPADFARSGNPMQTRGSDHITTWHPLLQNPNTSIVPYKVGY